MSAVLQENLTPELSNDEIFRITKYHRPSKQLEFLKSLGIEAKMRRDNTVLVLRKDIMYPASPQAANDGPKLKSSRK